MLKKVFSQEKKKKTKKSQFWGFFVYSDFLPFQEERGFRKCFLAPPLQYKMLKEKDSTG